MRNPKKEVLSPSIELAESPHFFKIILPRVLRDRKLVRLLNLLLDNVTCFSQGIPKSYIQSYGKFLSDNMSLKVPTGAVWKVGLTRGDDEVWLQSGWKEFAECYSIEYEHILVFRYEGHSSFSVLIFDKTACEIEYPPTKIGEIPPAMKEEMNESTSVEILVKERCGRRITPEAVTAGKTEEAGDFSPVNPSFQVKIDHLTV